MIVPLRIFIGYDSREPIAYHVLSHSILRRASCPVAIMPLVQTQLRDVGVYTRARGPMESTEFSLTRFLVPYLAGYRGHAIYLDSDMLCLADVVELTEYIMGNLARAVLVCPHEYTPRTTVKFRGHAQTIYPRKNWSSLMIFNAEKCRRLTREYVNQASGEDLHRFAWLGEGDLGTLPLEWNWLVGEYEPNPDAKILHYTLGGPWFAESRNGDHAKEWITEQGDMLAPWWNRR